MEYRGRLEGWDNIDADHVLIGDPPSFKILPKVKGKVYIYVICRCSVHFPGYVELYNQKKYTFIVNNRYFLKHFPDAFVVEGGTNTTFFTPKKRRVLYYAVKGDYIKQQLSNLPSVELVPFYGLTNEQLRELYKTGDYLVAWEEDGGWSNTAAEALASGLPVVTNGMNCEPFQDRVIVVKDLRKFFENPMQDFSWKSVTDKLETIMRLK
jgi:hypothetical protein